MAAKPRLLVLFIVYALLLPIVTYSLPASIKGILGALLIIGATILAGFKGGTLAAVWSATVIIVEFLLAPEVPLHALASGLLLYFLIGSGVGKTVDIIRRQRDEVTETVAELKLKQKELKESEERYRRLFMDSLDGIYTSTPDGRFIDVNPAMVKMLGYNTREELLSINIPEDLYLSRTDRPNPDERNRTFIARLKKKDGTEIWVETSSRVVFDEKGSPMYYEGIVRDITERKRQEERIKYLTFHDTLTGLYNRAYFEEELKRLDTERQLPLSLAMVDANGLKLVNDTFGHHEGDKLLKKIAKILKNSCRKEDIIARWGGDEFIILLPQTGNEAAIKVCERIKKACAETDEDPVQPSIAVGTATKTHITQPIGEVIREAEDRMYRNKLIESRSARSSIISSLQKTLWEKADETEEHAQRIKKLALEMGRMLGLSDNELDELALLAVLHDIGKATISDEILTKGGRLSAEEWKLIQKHPEIGYRIAESSRQLAPIADAILAHHEWWDGNGYPRGLKGEEIPLISRILAIVDAYDAMTHDRPYRKALSKQEAIEELKKCAGSQFDPNLVNVFVSMISRGAGHCHGQETHSGRCAGG